MVSTFARVLSYLGKEIFSNPFIFRSSTTLLMSNLASAIGDTASRGTSSSWTSSFCEGRLVSVVKEDTSNSRGISSL